MTYVPVRAVEVHAWGGLVGAVALDPATGFYAFEYSPEWRASGRELAPLHMPTTARRPVFEFPRLDPGTYHRLPALLADSLPDAFGNALVTHWMRTNGVLAKDITPLDRLAYAGARAMGALEFVPPATVDAPVASAVELSDLVSAARATVAGRLDEVGSTDALLQLINVGSSPGGARAKALVAFDPKTEEIRAGHGRAPEGFSQWLLKLDGTGARSMDGRVDTLGESAPFGRIEFAYALMAQAAGVRMTECRMLERDGRAHFMTRRFDRADDGARVHVSSLCAIDHLDFRRAGEFSYDQYLDVAARLGVPDEEVEQGFRRMVFNVIAVNRDDHTKNLAFVLPRDGAWGLAPAFDVTHAYNSVGEWTQRHQMLVNGRSDTLSLADLVAVGERHKVPGVRTVVREVLRAVDHWEEFARTAGVPASDVARMRADMRDMEPAGVRSVLREGRVRRPLASEGPAPGGEETDEDN